MNILLHFYTYNIMKHYSRCIVFSEFWNICLNLFTVYRKWWTQGKIKCGIIFQWKENLRIVTKSAQYSNIWDLTREEIGWQVPELIHIFNTSVSNALSYWIKNFTMNGNWTYRRRRCLRRPREEGIAPLSELLDKSLKGIKRYQSLKQQPH